MYAVASQKIPVVVTETWELKKEPVLGLVAKSSPINRLQIPIPVPYRQARRTLAVITILLSAGNGWMMPA